MFYIHESILDFLFLYKFIYFNHYHSHSLFLRNFFYLNRGNFFSIKNIFFFIIIIIFLVISWFFFYFTILYWFCHTSTWIHHKYTRVPYPKPPSFLPPCTTPLGDLPVQVRCMMLDSWGWCTGLCINILSQILWI